MKIQGPIVVFLLASGCSSPSGEDHEGIAGVWQPLSADELLADKTRAEWAVEWARWSYAQTGSECRSAANDKTGDDCGLYQDPAADVFFLSFSVATHRKHDCRVPAGKLIGVPVALVMEDNADPRSPHREDEQLVSAVQQIKDSMRELSVIADDQPVANVDGYGVDALRFDYHVPNLKNYYSCSNVRGVADTQIEPSYLAGYFLLFSAPTTGQHQLEYSSVLTHAGKSYETVLNTTLLVEDAHD